MNKKLVYSGIDEDKEKEVKEKNNLTDLVASILVGRNVVKE